MTRGAEAEAFLAEAGWAEALRLPLAGDASARSYTRLRRGSDRAMLMDIPPASGLAADPFLAVTDWLRGLGHSAPAILAADARAGLVLLEDLGDDLFLHRAADPALEPELYAAAIDLLVGLRPHLPAPTPAWTPQPYDRAVLQREMRLVLDWYLPAVSGQPASADLAEAFEAAAEPLIAIALDAAPGPVLRDYHAENLLWLPCRQGTARVGLLDYQDLLIGNPAYDVVSLLDDARRDLPAALRSAMLERYIERSGADRPAFLRAAAALSAQRNLKILGLFLRLARRDGKPGYLRHLPRVWGHLRRNLAHPDLQDLAGLIARHVPAPTALVPA